MGGVKGGGNKKTSRMNRRFICDLWTCWLYEFFLLFYRLFMTVKIDDLRNSQYQRLVGV